MFSSLLHFLIYHYGFIDFFPNSLPQIDKKLILFPHFAITHNSAMDNIVHMSRIFRGYLQGTSWKLGCWVKGKYILLGFQTSSPFAPPPAVYESAGSPSPKTGYSSSGPLWGARSGILSGASFHFLKGYLDIIFVRVFELYYCLRTFFYGGFDHFLLISSKASLFSITVYARVIVSNYKDKKWAKKQLTSTMERQFLWPKCPSMGEWINKLVVYP